MGVDTIGKIKGYVTHEQVFDFIKSEFDSEAAHEIKRRVSWPLSKITWPYAMEPHSDDNENEYSICGFIGFKYNGEQRSIFYHYCNVRELESIEHYIRDGYNGDIGYMLYETTGLMMRYNDDSVEIIEQIIEHFGGGWVDESDCDSAGYRPVC